MLETGSELGPWVMDRVDEGRMKIFANVLDDPNPLHLDPDAVRAKGLGDRVINQGPFGIGYLMNMLRTAVPEAKIEHLKARLLANVFGGDRVVCAGRVGAITDDGHVRRLHCEIWLDVDGAARAITGTAMLVLPGEPN